MAHMRGTNHEKSPTEAENSTILLKERYDLLKWLTNVEMRSPNFSIPVQIANYIESLPICKLAVSPKCDRVALMSYARQLDIYQINGEILDQESSVQVLEETSPEYCLLQFSSSSTLLLSSRSTPHIDVFDNMGAYCYDIPLEAHEGIFDVNKAICGMQTIANHSSSSNDKYIEILYVLQYCGVFSAFKIGRLSKYTKMWSVQLDIGQTGSFVVLPQYQLLLVSSHHKESTSMSPPAGLCSFKIMDMDPYIEPIRIVSPEGGFFSRLPFSTSFMSYLPKMGLSFNSQLLVSVSTSGSLYLFEIPSLRVKFSFNFISGPRPVEACFVDSDEIAVIYDNGFLLRCSVEDLEERMYSMKVKSKKQLDEEPDDKDIYSEHTVMVSPARREIFLLTAEGDDSVLREAAHKRVQLAGQLWLYTVWNSFKKLLGMAMGEPAEQLQMATHMAKFEFSLIHSPTRTLQELFNRTLIEHDYTRARELAETYDTIDIDVVLKSEWKDKCSKNQVTVGDVEEILKRIGDSEWIAEQCANADSDDFEVHKALIDLGLSLGESSVTWEIRLLHHWRILKVCRIRGDVEAYMIARKGSCLDAALSFAQSGDIDSLFQIIEFNMDIMKHHQKRILSDVPSCTSPTKYEKLMPKSDSDGEEEQWELEEKHDPDLINEKLNQILVKHPDAESLIRNINVGNVEDEAEFDFVAWVRDSLLKIDFECGLTDVCVELLQIAIERGYRDLFHDMGTWERYDQYVRICSSVSESITSFHDSTVKSFIDRFSRLLESELISYAEEIIGLIEWKVNRTEDEDRTIEERIRDAVTILMRSSNEKSTKVLVAYKNKRPDVVDDHVILEVLLNMTATGAELMGSLQSLPVDKYSNVTSSLASLMSRGVKMTFKSIFESMKEPDGARRVLIKLSRSGNCSTLEEWTCLRDDIYDMANGIYRDLVTTEEALELVAGEILEDERIGSHPELIHLVLTMNPKEELQNPKKLSIARSAEVLLAKSDELMSEATQRTDPLLGKARFFAATARAISPKKAKEKLDWLDAIDAALELGCTMMPIAIKMSDHDTLLRDVVSLGSNYKQGKKVLSFAKQLNIDTPIATALSYCALAALKSNDAVYLSKYIGEVMKAKGVPVVHQLCMQIMESPHVPTDMEDVYSCAINNSNDENLLETVDSIASSEKRLSESSRVREMRIEDVPVSENIVGDPMYTPMRLYNSRKEMSGDVKQKLTFFENHGKRDGFDFLKRLYAHESSTLALCYSLFHPAEDSDSGELSWTKNDKLRRYEKGLRFFQDRVLLSALVTAPASSIMKEANRGDVSITAIDRIEDYECDKSRFIGDAEYRTYTIKGLAETVNEQQFADALELASKYGIDEWELHMESLEYLLNPVNNVSRNDVKTIMKSRKHLSNLRSKPDEFHKRLRDMVLPFLKTNEQFLAYTSLFADTEPEKKVADTIKQIVVKIKEARAVQMWTDARYLSEILRKIPDSALRSITKSILLIPDEVGEKACKLCAEFILDGDELRPPANPFTVFVLMEENVEAFLDLISNKKSRDEEIAYLQNATLILENTPKVPDSLIDAVRTKAERMRRATVTPETTASSNGPSSFFSNPEENTGMMKRRRN